MEPSFTVLTAAIALPFLAAAGTPFAARILGDRVGYLGAVVAAVSFVLLLTQRTATGTVAVDWIPAVGAAVRLTLDGLGLLFALLASGIGVLIFLYATPYMHGKPNLGRFYATLLAFMGSILGVALAADLLLLFVFWELTSVCSFVLIGYYTDEEESTYSARMAMIVTVGGGLCLLAALLLIAAGAAAAGVGDGGLLGTLDLATLLDNHGAVRDGLESEGLFVPALILLVVAAAAKSAQVPLYFWLPRAMVAPTPVSAFLHSATMVKVGVYALGRFRPLFEGPEWTLVVASLGLVTMLVGAALAVIAVDIKELLAYSTASHLGLMVAGYGFGVHYGPEAGTFHLLNHALFKAALFLVAGIVAHEAGTRRIDDLSGLRSALPVTAAITVVAALSMAGLPPLSGFYSKEVLFKAAWETAVEAGGAAWLFPAIAVLASIFTVLYSLRFLWIFFGDRPAGLGEVHRPSVGLLASPTVLGVGVVVTTVAGTIDAPWLLGEGIVQRAAVATEASASVHAGFPTHLSGPVAMSAITIGVGIVAFPAVDRIDDGIEGLYTATSVLHPAAAYDHVLDVLDRGSRAAGPLLHDGRIRTYAIPILLATCALTLSGHAAAAVGLPTSSLGELPVAIALVLAVSVVAGGAVTKADSHVIGVLTLGILGFMLAILYVLVSGPDLALTQLVVETLVLLVFLLVIEQLPAFYGSIDRSTLVRDAGVSTVVGVTAAVSVLIAAPGPDTPVSDTADWYLSNAVKEGGGHNVVNVILTDFRAFDTLGESVVILTAALSVFVLLAMRTRGETR